MKTFLTVIVIAIAGICVLMGITEVINVVFADVLTESQKQNLFFWVFVWFMAVCNFGMLIGFFVWEIFFHKIDF